MRTALLVLGMTLLVLGGQGALRLLVDEDDAGLLAWLPGGPGVQLAADVLVLAAGVLPAVSASRAATPAD